MEQGIRANVAQGIRANACVLAHTACLPREAVRTLCCVFFDSLFLLTAPPLAVPLIRASVQRYAARTKFISESRLFKVLLLLVVVVLLPMRR